MANILKTTPEEREKFLEVLSDTGSITRAAEATSVGRRHWYKIKDADPEFAKEWAEARMLGCDALKDECIRRGVQGVEEPVYHGGEQVGTIRKYSDTLLIYMTKVLDPSLREQRVRSEISGPNGGPIETVTMTPEQRAARVRALFAQAQARAATEQAESDGDDEV